MELNQGIPTNNFENSPSKEHRHDLVFCLGVISGSMLQEQRVCLYEMSVLKLEVE